MVKVLTRIPFNLRYIYVFALVTLTVTLIPWTFIPIQTRLAFKELFSPKLSSHGPGLILSITLFQAELILAVTMWNSHSIRRSRNNIRYGQPNRMHTLSGLLNITDYLRPVSRNDITACRERVEFRSAVWCASDMYNVCIDSLHLPNIVYQHSRRLIQFLKYLDYWYCICHYKSIQTWTYIWFINCWPK